jgi:hypothetical protein
MELVQEGVFTYSHQSDGGMKIYLIKLSAMSHLEVLSSYGSFKDLRGKKLLQTSFL